MNESAKRIENALNVLDGIKDLVEEHRKMKQVLEDIFMGGNAYDPDPKRGMEQLQKNWLKIREILCPDFDDSE
jgi:hypothetical protein